MQPGIFTAVDAVLAIWRQRKLVVVVFLAVLMMVGLFTLTSEKTYLSDAKIFVRLGRENSALDVTAGLGDRGVYALPLNRDSEINSIAEMMVNKELYGQVVDRVGIERILKKAKKVSADSTSAESVEESKPSIVDSLMSLLAAIGVVNDIELRERAIIQLQKRTDVAVNKQSFVVAVTTESHDPKLAQDIVQTLVDAYLVQYAKTHRIDNGGDFLAKQTLEAEKRLAECERLFEEFKNRTRLISVDDQRKVYVDRIAKIENELLDTEALLRSTESEVEALVQQVESVPSSEPISQTAGAGNEAVDGMRQELFRLQVQREELLSRFQPSNPSVVRIEQQLAAARAIFEKTESQLVEKVEGPSRVYEGAKLQLMEKTPRLNALRSKKTELNRQLTSVVAELAQFNDNETVFLRLRRDCELCNENYKGLKRSLQQVNMDLAMQESNLSNLSVFQAASLNPKPFRPNKLINLVAGCALGLLLACSLAVLIDMRKHYFGQHQHQQHQHQQTAQPPALTSRDLDLDLLIFAEVPRQNRQNLLKPEPTEVS